MTATKRAGETTVVGIDIGSSSTKGVLATLDGTIVARATREHRISMPRPGWAEHDPRTDWWDDLVHVCRDLLAHSEGPIASVCVSGIGPCVALADAALDPLGPAILYGIDTRAHLEQDDIERHFGAEAIMERAGSAITSQALGPKLLWLRRHRADEWREAAGWYMASSYSVARLTGAYVLDHHSASQCTPMYDIHKSAWAEDWAEDIAPGIALPELVWPGEQVGTITEDAAAITGLPAGIPVAAGTIDAWAEGFSVGVREPGDLMIMYGTTLFLVQYVDRPRRHPLLWLTEGMTAGHPCLAAGMSTGGSVTNWVRDLTGSPSWSDLIGQATQVPPGSRGLLMLPYFAGERTPIYDPDARGVIAGLSLGHGPAELLRCGYEGIAFGIRQILELFDSVTGPQRRAVAVGGGAQSRLWTQIVSDVTGTAQVLPDETVGAAYGDALIGAIAAGLVAPETDWSTTAEMVEPDPVAREVYNRLYPRYLELYTATKPIVHDLAALGR
jgi:xylulokinase